MAQAQIVRHVAADPAGVALLLAGPAAEALWPTPADDVPDEDPIVRAGPPMRAGVGFVVDLTINDPQLGPARGRLSLVPAAGQTPLPGTTARLVLTATTGSAQLRVHGERYLDALESLAVARSSAA